MINDETMKKEGCSCENCSCEENIESADEETLEQAEIQEDLEFEGVQVETMEERLNELKVENEKITEENRLMNNKLSAMQDKHLRLTAEYDNYRKRTAKEKEQIYTDSCSDVLKEIFPVIDNLERAINMCAEESDLKKGVEMTLKQFQGALEKLNVEEISTEEKFYPNFHEAVMHIVDENYDESQIVEVFQKGYKRGEKVLRYSMVKVAN